MDVGLTGSMEFEVTDEDTAVFLMSGDLAVLATPRLVAWLEAATCAAIAADLDPGQTSVGTRVTIDHRAASAIGDSVLATATLADVDSQVLTFDVVATDHVTGTVLGKGAITRVVVDRERFMSRLER